MSNAIDQQYSDRVSIRSRLASNRMRHFIAAHYETLSKVSQCAFFLS